MQWWPINIHKPPHATEPWCSYSIMYINTILVSGWASWWGWGDHEWFKRQHFHFFFRTMGTPEAQSIIIIIIIIIINFPIKIGSFGMGRVYHSFGQTHMRNWGGFWQQQLGVDRIFRLKQRFWGRTLHLGVCTVHLHVHERWRIPWYIQIYPKIAIWVGKLDKTSPRSSDKPATTRSGFRQPGTRKQIEQ